MKYGTLPTTLLALAAAGLSACSDLPTLPGVDAPPLPRPQLALADNTAVTDLGILPGGTLSVALGVNDAGQVVGYGRLPRETAPGYAERAFLWTADDGMTDLGTLTTEDGLDWARANGINASGQVVGWSYAASRWQTAVIWLPGGGGPYALGSLATNNASNSIGFAINDVGQVVGQSVTTAGAQHAFLWTPSSPGGTTGTMQDLGTLGGSTSAANGISSDGKVVGQSATASGDVHAFLWTPGAGMSDLGTLGGSLSVAYGINASGAVVGYSQTATDAEHAFLWTAAGGMRDLGELPGSPSHLTVARAINGAGQIVGGTSLGPSWSEAWLWTAANGMADLGPAGVSSPYRDALAISGSGLIAGALIPVGGTERHAALWTVVATSTLTVGIDVLPGDASNTIRLKDKRYAKIAVAVLATPSFDPALIDPATVRIGDTPVASRQKGSLYASLEDADGDGDQDLVVLFERSQLIGNRDLTATTTVLTLTAALTGGQRVEGQDAVRVVSP